MRSLLLTAVLLAFVSSCASRDDGGPSELQPVAASMPDDPDMALTVPPYSEVHANWKQRLDQPYVFIEAKGSYTRIGDFLAEADRAVRDQGIQPSGPPFALFYDDPGTVAADALRARACFPVGLALTPKAPLAYDELESTTVVYAFVAGPYPDVPRAYPGLLAYMRSMSWTEAGPIREAYLVDPGGVSDWNQLVTEVQIPAAMR